MTSAVFATIASKLLTIFYPTVKTAGKGKVDDEAKQRLQGDPFEALSGLRLSNPPRILEEEPSASFG